MAYNAPSNTIALGKLTPTAGTPKSITSLLVGVLVDPYLPYANAQNRDDLYVWHIEIKALLANTGKVYVGYTGMNKTTMVGVLRVLDPGEVFRINAGQAGNIFHAGEFMVDVTATTTDDCQGFVIIN